jgi:hypothetical protein
MLSLQEEHVVLFPSQVAQFSLHFEQTSARDWASRQTKKPERQRSQTESLHRVQFSGHALHKFGLLKLSKMNPASQDWHSVPAAEHDLQCWISGLQAAWCVLRIRLRRIMDAWIFIFFYSFFFLKGIF